MTKLHHESFGDPGQPTMLLIQGLGAQMLGWREGFCRMLADGGFHVVRFDNRDTGLSQKFPGGGYSLADMAADAAGLLDDLGVGAAHIVGQSMGGMIAQQLTIDHPDRVLSLALVYTTPSLEFAIGQEAVEDRLADAPPSTRAEAVAHYLRSEEACSSTAYPRDEEWLRELGGLMWDRGYDLDGAEHQLGAVLTSGDRSTALARVTVPTTIVHGTADHLISFTASEAMHKLIDGSTLTVHDGMGHELPVALWPAITEQILRNAR